MTQDRDTVRSVAWAEVFPVLQLLGAPRIALSFRVLLLAAIALVGTAAGWRLLGELFHDPDNLSHQELNAQIEANRPWPWERPLVGMRAADLLSPEVWRHESPLVKAWSAISTPFAQVYRADISLAQWTYWLCCALWSLAVWAFFGGAITRIAAVSLARQETLSWRKVAGFVRPHWGSYFAAPLMPILATFMGAALLALVGLLMRSEVGLMVAGVLWPLVLVGGFIMAFLLIGLFFAWPLMWAAISTEGTDAFGALSHGYSYVYQRPLRYLWYALLAAVLGVLGWFIVLTFAEWIILLGDWGVSWGSGAERITEVRALSVAGESIDRGVQLIHFWSNCLKTLAFAYIFSYFWVASTAIYFLLRRLVDATELDEVYLPEEADLHGLPPLRTGADGVPEPADDNGLEKPAGEAS
ncbi:MAG: hypothetical protein AB7O59_03485 [Pirellulales bacterium]